MAILPQVAIFLLQIFSFSYLISMFIRQCSGLFNVQQTLVSVNANAIQNGISPQWLSLARLFSRLISMSVPRATRGAGLPIMGSLVHIAMRTPITLDFLCAWIRP